jgi:uncharacterized membrane protein YcfT
MDYARRDDRLAWVDYAKGICIVAVVCMYAGYYVQPAEGGGAGWMQYWMDFARPFRMPDFFLVAGLFLARSIDRPWREYLDKKIVHFVYFLVLWTTIYFVAEALLTRNLANGTPLWIQYLTWYVDPYHMLWFVAMLPVYFLVTRLVRGVPWWIILPLAALLQIAAFESGWRHFDRFGERYVYFYAGYAFAPLVFQFADWVRDNRSKALGLLALWAAVNEGFVLARLHEAPGFSLVLGFAGIGGVIAVAAMLQESRGMDWLRYLGRNSIVVFLAFYIPMVTAAKLLWRFAPPLDRGTTALLITIIGVFVPVIVHAVLRHTPARILFVRPRWAQLGTGEPVKARQEPVFEAVPKPAAS